MRQVLIYMIDTVKKTCKSSKEEQNDGSYSKCKQLAVSISCWQCFLKE